MSYILDALRKADAQRDRRPVPTLHANPVVGSTMSRTRKSSPAAHADPLRGWWLVAALLAGAAVVLSAWWLGRSSAPAQPASPPLPTTPAGVVGPGAIIPEPVAPGLKEPAAATASPWVAPPPAPPPPVMAKKPVSVPAEKSRVLTYSELPPDIQRVLPTLTVGGAMYSQNASSRMLIVNGQTVHEGQKLAPGLTLEQIQLKSAVLEFKGYRYSISY